MWGHVNKLCFKAARLYDWGGYTGWFTLDQAVLWAELWKDAMGDKSLRKEQALAFTVYGYTGYLRYTAVPGMRWDGTFEKRGKFDWYWAPMRPKIGD